MDKAEEVQTRMSQERTKGEEQSSEGEETPHGSNPEYVEITLDIDSPSGDLKVARVGSFRRSSKRILGSRSRSLRDSDENLEMNVESEMTPPERSLSPAPISRRSHRSGSPKLKSRFDEAYYTMFEEKLEMQDDEEEICKTFILSKEKFYRRKVKANVFIEWFAFVCILWCLVASLTVEKLEKAMIWGLELWKWCVLVMVIFSGMLVTNWFMHFVLFFIKRNLFLRKKILYSVLGLKKSVQVFIWLSMVLLALAVLFNTTIKSKILDYVIRTLISLLIGSLFWVIETFWLTNLASHFHVKALFGRIQESIFNLYVLQTLSRPSNEKTGQLKIRSSKKDKGSNNITVIDVGKVQKLKQEKVSAWTMNVLVDAVKNLVMSAIPNALYQNFDNGTSAQTSTEMEAAIAALRIFNGVADFNDRYIHEDQLLKFLTEEESDCFLPMIEGSETGKFNREALENWVKEVYVERKSIVFTLDDTDGLVKQLNQLVTRILIVVTVIIWLGLMKIATTTELFTPLLGAAFVFGNTCKTIFESAIFVFSVHPFDIGDRCVIDGIELVVEEMTILTTVFLKQPNNEKVYYPNASLVTKPIINYRRSPDMNEIVEFSIDFTTPVEKIKLLEDKIDKYMKKNPRYWQPKQIVVVKETEDANKLKMVVYCCHTINFQNFADRYKRRTKLVIKIKRILEKQGIKYHFLPQQTPPISTHMATESTDVASGAVLLSATTS